MRDLAGGLRDTRWAVSGELQQFRRFFPELRGARLTARPTVTVTPKGSKLAPVDTRFRGTALLRGDAVSWLAPEEWGLSRSAARQRLSGSPSASVTFFGPGRPGWGSGAEEEPVADASPVSPGGCDPRLPEDQEEDAALRKDASAAREVVEEAAREVIIIAAQSVSRSQCMRSCRALVSARPGNVERSWYTPLLMRSS